MTAVWAARKSSLIFIAAFVLSRILALAYELYLCALAVYKVRQNASGDNNLGSRSLISVLGRDSVVYFFMYVAITPCFLTPEKSEVVLRRQS